MLDRVPTVDRNRARAYIKGGMMTASVALFAFGFAFYVAVLYLG
jgi:hypothetical protein